jgi:hypothetical protein
MGKDVASYRFVTSLPATAGSGVEAHSTTANILNDRERIARRESLPEGVVELLILIFPFGKSDDSVSLKGIFPDT